MKKPHKEKRLIGVEDLATYIGSTPGTIRQKMYNNKLPFPYVKFGKRTLFDLDEVDAWIDGMPRYGGPEFSKEAAAKLI